MYIECMTDRERHIERLFRQHYSAMHRLAYMLLHDDDDSKDVVHDVFAKLLVEQTELREATVLPYLLSCVRNQCLNMMRNRNLHDQLQQYLAKNGVETQIHYPIPPHKQRCYKEWSHLSLPITEQIHAQELSIPCHQTMTPADATVIVNLLNGLHP